MRAVSALVPRMDACRMATLHAWVAPVLIRTIRPSSCWAAVAAIHPDRMTDAILRRDRAVM